MFFVSYFCDSSCPLGSLSHLYIIQFLSATPDPIILELFLPVMHETVKCQKNYPVSGPRKTSAHTVLI